MNQPRSIRARLITLYMVTLSLIFICFGGYTYWGFKQYLIESLQQTLVRRAHQVAVAILADLPEKGESYVSSEIQIRYAPELNERIIRITDASGRTIYASKNAGLLSSPPPLSSKTPLKRSPSNARRYCMGANVSSSPPSAIE